VHLPGGDLVHGDFNSCNALLHDGQVSGIIDIEQRGFSPDSISWPMTSACPSDLMRRLVHRLRE
jgi:aminoglycoside phosphotransferase